MARDRLERPARELARPREALAARLVEIYKADEPDALTVVLEADGFADLLERTEFLDRISTRTARIIDRVRALRDEAERQAERARGARGAREEVADGDPAPARRASPRRASELVSAHADLRGARNDRAARALARCARAGVRARGRPAPPRGANAAAQSALQGAGAAAPARRAPAGPIRQGLGRRCIWPVNGPVVSAASACAGAACTPGIDIAVAAGTPIRAADSGRVVLMGVIGGYGNYTCIQHTGSLSTCYAHQSSFGTSNGASVSQGQVIGYVGCTGHCFGDHLHFETRVNGSPVDPMGYL